MTVFGGMVPGARRARVGVQVAVLVSLIAGCGGGDDATSATTSPPATPAPATTAPATTSPATTAPPPTAPPTTPPETAPPTTAAPTIGAPLDGERVTAADGLVSVVVPDGWSFEDISDPAPLVAGDEWESTAAELALLTGGSVVLGVFREGHLVGAPSVVEWRDVVVDQISPDFVENVIATADWGGGSGEVTLGRDDSGWYRIHTLDLDGVLLGLVAYSPVQPTQEADELVSQIVDSIEFDLAALPPLAEGQDVRRHASEADTGSTPFTISVLAPAAWTWEDTGTATVASDPIEGGFAGVELWTTTGDLDEEIAYGMETYGAEFFELEPVREDVVIDGVPSAILWEGDPAVATAAAVYGNDGTITGAAYFYAPDDHDLLVAMVESVLYPDHAPIG